jgi:hypothetical protein
MWGAAYRGYTRSNYLQKHRSKNYSTLAFASMWELLTRDTAEATTCRNIDARTTQHLHWRQCGRILNYLDMINTVLDTLPDLSPVFTVVSGPDKYANMENFIFPSLLKQKQNGLEIGQINHL